MLRVYAETANAQGITLRRVADTTWNEATITWATAPTLGPTLAPSGPISAGSWVTFDVSAALEADGAVAFALTSPSSTATRLSSRNGSNPPQLVVAGG